MLSRLFRRASARKATGLHFEIRRDRTGEWRWRLRAANGKIIAVGEGYVERRDCLHCIGLVKASADAPVDDKS